MKIKVRNFQSLEDVLLEVSGLTVITGKSNLGKSALIRAIGGSIFGIGGDYFVRFGTLQCGVGIADTNLVIKWRKVLTGKQATDRETSLEVNGTKNTKIGRDHALLTEDLGFKEIRVGPERFRPQVASQLDPVFLLTETETTVAEIFKLLGRVDVVTEAQRMVKKDYKENVARLKVRKEDVETVEKGIQELDSVDPIRKRLTQLSGETFDSTKKQAELTSQTEKLKRLQFLEELLLPFEPTTERPTALDLLPKLNRFMALGETTIPDDLLMYPDYTERTRDLLSQYLNARYDEDFTTQERIYLDQAIFLLEEEKQKAEQELKICPTCGGSFGDHNHVP